MGPAREEEGSLRHTAPLCACRKRHERAHWAVILFGRKHFTENKTSLPSGNRGRHKANSTHPTSKHTV